MKNNFNIVNFLPEDFTEDERYQYEVLTAESKRIYSYIDDFSIHLAVIAYINEMKGKKREYTDEELKETINRYDNKTMIYQSPNDEDYYLEIEKQANEILKNKISALNIENNE